MLPRRLPNFGKANNFVCLTTELPFFLQTYLDQVTVGKITLFGYCRLARTMSGQNYFFPGLSDPSFYGFYNGNAEYERQFF